MIAACGEFDTFFEKEEIMLVRRIGFVAVLAVMLGLKGSFGWATPLTPLPIPSGMVPTNATPVQTTLPLGATIVKEESSSYSVPGTISGYIISAVVQLPGTTSLDFLYQFTNNAGGSASVSQPEVLDILPAYTTSVGYLQGSGISAIGSPPFVATGSILPAGGIDRANYQAGAVTELIFDFTKNGSSQAPAFPAFGPGTQSVVFVVQTNATSYANGSAFSQDGGPSTDVPAYVPFGTANPTVPVPEPTCLMGIFGLASMAGLGIVWRRKR